MKRDAALAALNSNYREQWRARCLLMSLEVFWGSDMETEPYIKVSVAEVGGSHKIDSRLSTTSKWEDEPATPQIDECIPSIQLFALLSQIPTASPQRGGRGEREWQGPLLKRVDYLMKGNQLERYGGLWTFIHLAWPLLNFHDGLWLFRGRDQS